MTEDLPEGVFVSPNSSVLGELMAAEGPGDLRDSAVAAVEVVVLACILLLAVVGNAFVLLALWRHSLSQPMSRCYLFMLHLSLADLLVAVLNILPQLIWDITYRFRGPDALCRAVKYAQVFVLYVATYVLVFMAVDRARAVQGSGRGSLRGARLMIGAAWGLGLLLAIPQAFLFAIREVSPGVLDCWGAFEVVSERAYVTCFVVFVFLLPLFVIALCYGYICRAVWRSSGSSRGPLAALGSRLCPPDCVRREGPRGTQGLELQAISARHRRLPQPSPPPTVDKVSAAKMKTIRMTFVVVFVFVMCWLPFCVAQLLTVYNKPKDPSTINPVAVVCLLLVSLNSCTNPWIYLYFSATLLNQLRVVLGFGPSRCSNDVSIGNHEPRVRPLGPGKRPAA